MAQPDWIAADAGAGGAGAWAMTEAGEVLDRAEPPPGGRVTLADLSSRWLVSGARVPVLACGLTAAEAARKLPCAPLEPGPPLAVGADDPSMALRLVPGLRQDNPPVLTEGAETRIAGFLDGRPDFDGVLCLTGAMSLWAHVSAGEVVSMRAFLSGELAGAAGVAAMPDPAAVADAAADTISRPEALAAKLAEARTALRLGLMVPEAAQAGIAGALIGAELAAARPYWLGQELVLVGYPAETALYSAALAAQGLAPQALDGAGMALAGLCAAWRGLVGTRA
ncbi:2-dehydro-3-deoxygalactonokinase [Maritimibacter sp. 55A14]|uniref:2-dehydro-3-deoxygalactonokinase n=1 Tax=Maritimibacter sp. 55A14 TaxID=2174844 RepID=UPI0011B25B23|nr:2-dehydro-3-deoxygalactonokinase [Maritimibacter sp. 55A14]